MLARTFSFNRDPVKKKNGFPFVQARPMGPGVAGGPTAAAVVAASEGKAKKYGLLGLLGVIRMTDPDLNTLALGSDLTTVGLNLDSAEVRRLVRGARGGVSN